MPDIRSILFLNLLNYFEENIPEMNNLHIIEKLIGSSWFEEEFSNVDGSISKLFLNELSKYGTSK